MIWLAIVAGFLLALCVLHVLSYWVLKTRTLRRQRWDLNICCGRTDGGGVNADIVQHADVPRFRRIDDIRRLPFKDGQFDTVLCSHTMEHVTDPEAFFRELRRVGKSVTLVLPPLWDVLACLCVFEHKWLFLTFHKQHSELPRYVRLPFASTIQKCLGQRIRA